MTTWTTTMAVGTRIRHRGEVHIVTAIEGSLATFRSPPTSMKWWRPTARTATR